MSFLILLIGITAYLRTIGYLVAERENRCLEHMQIMGVKKITYFFASFLSSYLFLLLIGLVYAFFIKVYILRHVNGLLIYIHQMVFLLITQIWAYLISTVFISTKNSIIFGIIFWIAF